MTNTYSYDANFIGSNGKSVLSSLNEWVDTNSLLYPEYELKHWTSGNNEIPAIFIGIILGLAVGAIPLHLPGISAPVRLGLAGGPIIVGILIGTFGPRLHMITYTTLSANLMLRGMFLFCM